jgi:RNA polymerase sigma-70 factor, ECF subfamily
MTVAEVTRDDVLAAAAIAGDDEAFSAIYDLLATRVFNFVLRSVHERFTAEDICQEIWLKAHREIRTLKSPGALRTWLFRMASRACIDYTRSKTYRERRSPAVSDEMLELPAHEPETVAVRQAELRVMWEALAALPPRQSMALYLKQVDGCSYEEIARILGCRRTAVETLLFRARQGFAQTHERFQADPSASCRMIGATMAVVLDKEGTPFQERAVQAHLSECRTCREEMDGMKRGAAGYAWLPMLPIGGQALSAALAGGTAGAGAGIGISRIVGMLLVQGKSAGLAVLAVGALATTVTAAGAAAGVTPSPLDGVAAVKDVGTAVRNATIGGGSRDESASLKTVSDRARPPLAPILSQPAVGASGPLASNNSLPPASQLDPAAALSGLPGLLSNANDGLYETVTGLTAYLTDTLDDVLSDPLGTIRSVLQDPTGSVDDLAQGVTGVVDQTTQNATGTVNQTAGDVTGIVDSTLGQNVTQPVDDTVAGVTGAVDETVDGATGIVDDATSGLDSALGGDDGLLGGDDGLVGGLLGGGDPPPPADPPPAEDPPSPPDDGGGLLPCVPLPLLPCN